MDIALFAKVLTGFICLIKGISDGLLWTR